MHSTLIGVIRGRILELEEDPGLEQGALVRVKLDRVVDEARLRAMQKAFGGWADDVAGVDAFVNDVYEARRQESDSAT